MVGSAVSSLLLVAHGSRDARAARSTWALTRAVGAARAGSRVSAAFLDFEGPRLPAALAELARPATPAEPAHGDVRQPAEPAHGDVRQPAEPAHDGSRQLPVTVVPLLLTAAYHGRVDVPGEVAKAPGGTAVAMAEVLGPVAGPDDEALDPMVRALRRRLSEALAPPAPAAQRPDGVVLVAAGTRVAPALATVDLVASALSASLGVPCLPGYASGSGSTVAEAVASLREAGARRIAAAAYFLAPGRLYDRAVREAEQSGVVAVAAPLGDAPEVVRLVLLRADSATLARERVA